MGSHKKKPLELPAVPTDVSSAGSETGLTATEQLAAIKKQEKDLKAKIKDEKKAKVQERKDARVSRNKKLKDVKNTLDAMQDEVHIYNRKGKSEKEKTDILGYIKGLIKEFEDQYPVITDSDLENAEAEKAADAASEKVM
jgi:hypothetical protein